MHKTRHQSIRIDDLDIFFRHAGDAASPAILLLHGVPSSSHMFRRMLEPLAEIAYVVAPDLPGFGFSSAPMMADYAYTFENLSYTIEQFRDAIGLERFFLFMNDFGTPVGYHVAMRHPDRILGLIVQNGNAHEEGLGPQWDAPRAYWAIPTEGTRANLPEWLNFEGTRDTYIGGLPERLQSMYPPESWHLDWERMSRPGNIEIQFQLFNDYQHHVARLPAISAYHQRHQPPCLLLWGRHDPYFDLDEIMAYNREMETIETHLFESGHFLLETHHRECAELVKRFVLDTLSSEPGDGLRWAPPRKTLDHGHSRK